MSGGPKLRLLVGLVALVLVAAACSSGGGSGEPSASLRVDLSGFEIVPATIRTQPGQPVTLEVTNTGQAPHAMAVDAAGTTVETPMLGPGQTTTLQVPALDAGEYRVWCTVPGHAESSMEAVLAVGTGQAAEGQAMTAEEMAAMEEAPIAASPAETEGQGGRVLEPFMDGEVKVFTVHAAEVRWEVAPGEFVEAFAYNGQIPGPEIRVQRGDRVRVVLENELPQPTTIHFHGLTTPNAMDGVPFITQDPVMPGTSFVYEFTVKDPPGTYMYHSHFNALEQVGRGLAGTFVVEPEAPAWDAEATVVLWDGELGYTLNGKSFPATAPIAVARGQRLLIRFLNAGQQFHPMHLHGYQFQVLNEDGHRLPKPYSIDTLNVGPGQRFDVLVEADLPGVWAFHCHVLSHVEGPHGMFGMVTALAVAE